MIESKLFLELLVRLFTDPSGLDGSGEHPDGGIAWQVRHIVFLLSGRPPLADEPDFVARHGLDAAVEHPVPMAIGKPDTAGGEAAGQSALGALSPTDLSPFLFGQHRLGGNRRLVRNVIFAAISGFGNRKDQGNFGWVDILAARQTHRPFEAAPAQSLAERPA